MVSWQKLSAAIGSATPDPMKSEATAQPIPAPSVANKPPPGRKGPVGMQPRQTYSRVNTGAPPIPDAGTMTQKSQRPRGLEFLPNKVAQQEIPMTTMMRRPSLGALVKEAMEGTASSVDINTEAMFQEAHLEDVPQEKTAAARTYIPDVVPTAYVEKVAAALDFLSKQAEEGTNKLEPGKGPGALEVMESDNSGPPLDVNMGQAKTQIPMAPPMTSSGVAKDPSNAMAENIDMSHPEQPVDPMGNEKTSAIYANNLRRLGLLKEAGGSTASAVRTLQGMGSGAKKAKTLADKSKTLAGPSLGGRAKAVAERIKHHAGKAYDKTKGHLSDNKGKYLGGAGAVAAGTAGVAGYRAGKKKKASANLVARNLMHLGLYKQAEDAIAPASIGAGKTQTGATPPEGVSPSEEGVPSEPSDVNSQKAMISSNQAAIDYTKGKAKADPKSDVNKVLVEPALTSSTDTVLKDTFANTGAAGVKISHIRRDLTKTAAAQALLSKIAMEAEEEKAMEKKEDKKNGKKEKTSQGMPALSGPSAGAIMSPGG